MLREEIDRLDGQLLELINQRARLAQEIGRLKAAAGGEVYAPDREAEVLQRAVEQNPGPLQPGCVRAVFRELISGARALEQRLRVAFLGPEYSYSHLAALHQFGQSVDMVPVATIAAVFEEVHRRQADYGVVPLENSTDGGVADTLDMFTRLSVRVCGEVPLRIHHYLLGKCPRDQVREIYSKPQAISQCRNWLAKHMPGARTFEVTSTSTAAELASEKPATAAIASLKAGIHFGLNVLAEKIEDNPANVTRFAVLGQGPAPRTGRDKTALMFEVPHKPGALADATAIFKRNRLNMTWIESFPIPRPEGGYVFFVEVLGHINDAPVRKALEALKRRTLRLEVLGAYPASSAID